MHVLSSNDFLQHADWSFPVPIAYGPGRFDELPDHCQRLGLNNPLIITDSGTASLTFVSDALDLLAQANIASSIFHNMKYPVINCTLTPRINKSLLFSLRNNRYFSTTSNNI